MYGVVDCNNFFVSCERVFNPATRKIPVVVLSNNDGCIIARSEEVKALGFPMGAPIFQYRDLVKENNVQLYSANFSLYADMSSRVMMTIREYAPRMELYSIDEAFVDFSEFSPLRLEDHSRKLRKTILKDLGIETSIGIAPTKTLAKIGSEVAKKQKSLQGVCIISDEKKKEILLKGLKVGEVWGIGRKLSVFLEARGICTAYQLMNCEDAWVRQQMSISVCRTVWELRGTPCIELDSQPDPKKSIISSRSFGKKVERFADLEEAMSTFISRATEKLRQERETASCVTVAVMTNYHKKGQIPYYGSDTRALDFPTDYTPHIMKRAREILKSIYKNGYIYKKVMVVLTGLSPKTTLQTGLFHSEGNSSKEEKLMKVLDQLNTVWGSGTLEFASQGVFPAWKGRSEKRSPRYTTRWDELVRVKC
jgi:DNA polymerase V